MNEREFDFKDKDFNRVKTIVYDYAGIDLNESKKNLVYNRLSKRIRFLKMQTFSEYLDFVEAQGEAEFVHLINAITTNLTFFFREIFFPFGIIISSSFNFLNLSNKEIFFFFNGFFILLLEI